MAASCYNELMGLGAWPDNPNLFRRLPMQSVGSTYAPETVVGGADFYFEGLDGLDPSDLLVTAGPSGYLPSCYIFDFGSAAYPRVRSESAPLLDLLNGGTLTILHWSQTDSTPNGTADRVYRIDASGASNSFFRATSQSGSLQCTWGGYGQVISANPAGAAPLPWQHFAQVVADNNYLAVYCDADLLGESIDSPVGSIGERVTLRIGNLGPNNRFVGRAADFTIFSAALEAADISEHAQGPEPVIAGISPTIDAPDGSAVGDTLTVTDPGTWDLPAPFAGLTNGPFTYQYRWIRSGHGVISGATDSTYTLTGDDYGRSVWSEVLAGNDGGTDPSQWAASNAIAVEVISNVTPPTLQINADGTWTGGLGTWSGNPTNYAWELRRAVDDSVVDSGATSDAGAVLVGSLFISGDYYLWVYAENSGGSLSAVSSTAVMQVGSQITFDAFRTSRRIMGEVRMGRRILGEVRIG